MSTNITSPEIIRHSDVLIPYNYYLSFESDMVLNANIKIFQPFKVSISNDKSLIYLKFEVNTHHQSVQELIEINYFQKNHIVEFVQAVIRVSKICDEHLLSRDCIDFSPKSIYYDPKLGDYIWRYVPTQDNAHTYTVLDLFRHLLIETNVISQRNICDFVSIQLLSSTSFSLETLLENLTELRPEKTNKSKPFWAILNASKRDKNVMLSDNIVRSSTTHNTHYPILLDKVSCLESHKIYFELNTIGRDENNNIFISSDSVSRKHAIIYKEDFKYKIKDLKSTNGTFVNGKSATFDVEILNGDSIQFGEKEYIFIR